MLLAINIGNSFITFGGYTNGKLDFVSKMFTQVRRTQDQYAVELQSIMKLYTINPNGIDCAIISSVVPEITNVIKDAVKTLTGVNSLVVGPGVKSGLNILIDNPAQLGGDIVACAVAATSKKQLPCIIYDLGTATTVSVIDGEGRFVGVIISAGVGTTLEMFTSKTALLPNVSIEAPKTVIGKNTIHSMQSGLVYGTASMLDGLASRIERELGEKTHIIATGEMAKDIIMHCERKIELREHLLLDGLSIIYEKNVRR